MARNETTESPTDILSAIKEMTAGDPPLLAAVRFVSYVPIALFVALIKAIIAALGDAFPFIVIVAVFFTFWGLLEKYEHEGDRHKYEKCTSTVDSLCSQAPAVEECFERVFPSCINEGKPVSKTTSAPTVPKSPEQPQE